MDEPPERRWLLRVGILTVFLVLLASCSSGNAEPSADNLELNEAVLDATPLPEGTTEVKRSSQRQDVEGRYCIDITSVVLQPADRDVDDEDIVSHYEDHFAAEGWAIHHGTTRVGSVVTFDSEGSFVTMATENLASDNQYRLRVSHPC